MIVTEQRRKRHMTCDFDQELTLLLNRYYDYVYDYFMN